MDITHIVVAFVCGLVPTLLTLWLNEKIKGSVQNSFDKKLEEVKKEHSKEIAHFQTELNHLKSKENFKFTKLHEERFEILKETYKFLNEHISLLTFYLEPNKYIIDTTYPNYDESTLRDNYRFAHNNFFKYFSENLIFFSEDIEEQLKKYFTLSAKIYNIYNIKNDVFSQLVSDGYTIDVNAQNAIQQIPTLLIPIKIEIEKKFRELLGE